MKVEHNISRLNYLLEVYRMHMKDFLQKISEGLKKPITEGEVFGNEIKLSHLKRIDKVFEKGLMFYLDPKDLKKSKEASIFFRKQNFQTEHNFGAKKVINKFEDLKLLLSGMAKLSNLRIERQLHTYTINNNPKQVAKEIRKLVYPEFNPNRKNFLKAVISKLAHKNILVFEFVETWNKKNKANIDGFYLKPNMIVLKRHKTFHRELFTLAHELGHYLLQEEEIEEVNYSFLSKKDLPALEKWCNDFAFFFLAGDFAETLNEIKNIDLKNNDYIEKYIEKIAQKTHLSPLALLTRLLYQEKISESDYFIIKKKRDMAYKNRQEEREKEKNLLKEQGIKQGGAIPKPISSPLFVSIIQTAYYEGLINEYEVCQKLNIKSEKLDQYI